jgi:hypothetical protein
LNHLARNGEETGMTTVPRVILLLLAKKKKRKRKRKKKKGRKKGPRTT